MINCFDEEARKILIMAKAEMQKLKHPYVGSEHLLLSILKNKNEISLRLKEYNLNYQKIRQEIIKIVGEGTKESECFLYTPLLKRIMETAMLDSRENNNGVVTVAHLFSALLEEGEGVAIRIMIGMDIDIDALYRDFSYKISFKRQNKDSKLLIDEIGVDLTKMVIDSKFDPVVGRDDEIKRILEILCRRKKNNPLLIGEAGVGKTAIVEELSRLIALGEVPQVLKNKRIISIDTSAMVAGTKYRGEFEERINNILKEIEDNDNIILFIDEIHTLVGAGGAEGAIDASNIFKPALARNKIRCIGATTTAEYKKFIEEDKALDRRFQKVIIDIPNKTTVRNILINLKRTYEDFHHTKISDEMIDLIIELSDKYIYNRNQPDKAIDILDEVCAHVHLKENKQIKEYADLNRKLQNIIKSKQQAIINNQFDKATNFKREENKLMNDINNLELEVYKQDNYQNVTKNDILEIVSRKANIPIYMQNNNTKDIINLKKELEKKIIGQDKAISELVNIYKKIKLGYKDNKCYSLLFQGPSGVGKTELAKIFGEKLTNNVIKLDMSEYSEPHSISKLIGSPAGYVGYGDNKHLFDKIKNNPFSVLILDEIERAHTNVINLFFQILDDGTVKDAMGNNINFQNVIIIMTSNVGFENNNLGFTNSNTHQLKETFSIPFINRIDNIIIFNRLSKDNITKLIVQRINHLKTKYANQHIKIGKKVYDEIVEETNFIEFGARKIDKIIKNKLESNIIDKLINCQDNIYIKTLNKLEVNI
ncbi:MAG: ATP-dependent Clp protease ATP-binding subunit [Bacilli bacterium]|nr:ATP-dependent Clp protease ATP-binding subunit [Bacilli bacterium]